MAEDGLLAMNRDSLLKASLHDCGKGGLYFARFNVRIDSLAQQRYDPLNDSYTLRTKERIGMGTPTRVRAAVVLLALLGSFARAQEPTSPLENAPPSTVTLPLSGGLPPTPASALSEHPLLAGGCPCDCGDGGTMFDLDLMLGMLLGVRAQAAVYRNRSQAFVIEGFYGALLDGLEASEGAGAGGRYYFRRTDRAGCNSLLIGPGIGAYCHFRHQLWMVAPTIDVAWVRPIGDRGAWQLGLNAGVGVGVAGDSDTNRVGRTTPLITLFTGFRF